MRIVINPLLQAIREDWLFQNMCMGHDMAPRSGTVTHARIATNGDISLCATCHSYVEHHMVPPHALLKDPDDRRRILLDLAYEHIAGLCRVLGIRSGTAAEIRETGNCLWHRIDGTDELVHSPFDGLTSHEILESHAEALDDASPCRQAFDPLKTPFGKKAW